MRAVLRRLSRDESGQSIVIFVFMATALFATAALVINVGHFLQARQLAQGTADAAALAAVQEDPRVIFEGIDAASEYAEYNWPDSKVTDYHEEGRYPGNPNNVRTSEDVSVKIEKTVPALFGGFLDTIGVTFLNLDVKAFAAARSEPVLTINQISPIALYCDATCRGRLATLDYPWPVDGSGSPVPFDFVVGHPELSGFTPIAFHGATTGDFGEQIACNPAITAYPGCIQEKSEASNLDAASCGPANGIDPCWYLRLTPKFDESDNYNNAAILRSYLEAAEGPLPHLVGIYDAIDQTGPIPQYHVIGWAAFSFTVEDGDNPGDIRLRGQFHKLFVGADRLSVDGFGGSLNDFGVRAVGLSQ